MVLLQEKYQSKMSQHYLILSKRIMTTKTRIGKCKRWGWCCSCITIWVGVNGKFTEDSFLAEIKPQERCKAWDEATKSCLVHEGDQPELCRGGCFLCPQSSYVSVLRIGV